MVGKRERATMRDLVAYESSLRHSAKSRTDTKARGFVCGFFWGKRVAGTYWYVLIGKSYQLSAVSCVGIWGGCALVPGWADRRWVSRTYERKNRCRAHIPGSGKESLSFINVTESPRPKGLLRSNIN